MDDSRFVNDMRCIFEALCGRQGAAEDLTQTLRMILVNQAPGGALSAKCSLSSPAKFMNANLILFSNRKPKFITGTRRTSAKPLYLTLAKAEGGADSGSATKPSSSNSTSSAPFGSDQTVFVRGEDAPLEGVIQFEKPSASSRIEKWG